MTIDAASTLTDVAFEVCTALSDIGVIAVLTGGSAATYYAPDAYQSKDLDFVVTFQTSGATQRSEAIEKLGFDAAGDMMFKHRRSHFTVDILKGPLAVGDDYIDPKQCATYRRGKRVLHVLTATDACRDRLTWFLLGPRLDYQALEQALAICRARDDVDLELIRAWCVRERQLERYELFVARLR